MIHRLLEAAENVIAQAPHCWLVTLSSSGGVNARPMGRITSAPSQSGWNFSFLADSRSKKARDIHSATQVRLIFENGDDAFVSLAGAAEVISDTAVIGRRWIPNYDRIFPSAADKTNAVFIDIRAEELRLWIRELTPEPFGIRSLTLRRPLDGDWHLDSEHP
jgi:general stress protein 26